MKKSDLNRITIKGGIISPSELLLLLQMLEEMKLKEMSLGSRQDILFSHTALTESVIENYPQIQVQSEGEKVYKNVSCSYVADGIFIGTRWLTSSRYLYILDDLMSRLRLSVNIVDPLQPLVPLFTANLNFIASPSEEYWYLYVKLPLWDKFKLYPVWIHSSDINLICSILEEGYGNLQNIENVFTYVNERVDPRLNKNITIDLKPTTELFPHYEGMNRMSGDMYWLGLYWRNNNYYIDFLKDVAQLCMDSRVGRICITPWKSIIIKNIHRKDKMSWEKLLGGRGINIRHSLLELNWHIPVGDMEAQELKKYIVSEFDKKDISTYGMTFGIYNESTKSPFTTIAIYQESASFNQETIGFRPTYRIMHTVDFDIHSLDYDTYAIGIDRLTLPNILVELSKAFFRQLGRSKDDTPEVLETSLQSDFNFYQCSTCFTVYDEALGDPDAGVAQFTPFIELSDNYTCSMCEGPKTDYRQVDRKSTS